MVSKLLHFWFVRLTLVLLSSTLIFFASSCGHTQASQAPAAPDPVMQTIHDYGRGHSGLLTPGITAMPTEEDEAYVGRIWKLLKQEDFAQLQEIARQDRTEKGRLLGGIWKIQSFYETAGNPIFQGVPQNADYETHIARIKKWMAMYPDSTIPRLALAYAYLDFADFGRGPGFADTVSDDQWKDYYGRTAQAKTVLLEASDLNDKDPFWFYAMLQVGHREGWDKLKFRELLDAAVAFEPEYYHYYRAYATYILPRWYGEPGEIPAFAEEISGRMREPAGSITYFRIISSLACYCHEAVIELPNISYVKVRLGYTNVTKLYGASNLNANRFAYLAAAFHDQASAKEAFSDIHKMEMEIWNTQDFYDSARGWANGEWKE